MIFIVAWCIMQIFPHLLLLFPNEKWCYRQDVETIPDATFAKKICNQYSSLSKKGDVVTTT